MTNSGISDSQNNEQNLFDSADDGSVDDNQNSALPTKIDPKIYETSIYQDWLAKNYFHADENSSKPAFSIVMPPPNVTGVLHVGHALNATLQDIIIRFHKLSGYEVLLLPGTDHAGIATQNVVEKQLAKDGITKEQLGREKFLEKVWEWKHQSGSTIEKQMERLGIAADWKRKKFTMDDDLSELVRKVFVDFYKKGLIYKGQYLVNWCPRCTTALSDLEVEHSEHQRKLYTIKYKLDGKEEYLNIATTRPETIFADTAIAVNPNDTRYKHLIGQYALIPLSNKKIVIIGDEYVDMEFGTGCLKVTPAHDTNDFALGKKHNLDSVSVIDERGKLTELAGEFAGLDRFVARDKVTEKLDSLGLLAEVVEHASSIGHCQRCQTVVEPRVSTQWFLKTETVAKNALDIVQNGNIEITPKQWNNLYYDWMTNIKDWCISRQLWWGHRIPASTCNKCGHLNVAEGDIVKCEKCGSTDLTHEEDVLDTWFSSGLWPFATTGWANHSLLSKKFFPTSLLVTAFDIIFFWVSRMIMMGLEFTKEVPFRQVYIHALVRDEHGQKMSKSKGNVLDPLELVDEYGADTLRFALAISVLPGKDIRLSKAKIELYRNFSNKIWNASRFILMNAENNGFKFEGKIDVSKLDFEDKWIIAKAKATAETVRKSITNYNFYEGANTLFQFFWYQFCDWYIELMKLRVYKNINKDAALSTALYVLQNSLIMLHPFMPFVTEYVYKILRVESDPESIMLASFPTFSEFDFAKEERNADVVIGLISNIRNIRGEYNLKPTLNIDVFIKSDSAELKKLIHDNELKIKSLAKIEKIEFVETFGNSVAINFDVEYQVGVELEGLVDFNAELKKLKQEKTALEKKYSIFSGKLNNPRFLESAPPDVIEKDKITLDEVTQKLAKVNELVDKFSKIAK